MNIAAATWQAWESLYDGQGSDENSIAVPASDAANARVCRSRTHRAASNRIRRDENRSPEVFPNRSTDAPREKASIAAAPENFPRPPPAAASSPTTESPT